MMLEAFNVLKNDRFTKVREFPNYRRDFESWINLPSNSREQAMAFEFGEVISERRLVSGCQG